VLALQRSAGNAAVAQLLSRSSAPRSAQAVPANAPALRAALEAAGDGGGVGRAQIAREGAGDAVSARVPLPAGGSARVFAGPRARRRAARMGAYAYSWRGDVYLGAGVGEAGGPSRAEVLRHELAHARQARRSVPRAAEPALEAEARDGGEALAADPEEPLGWFWFVALAAGAYVLLRPNVANAPSPEDVEQGRLRPSVSELQVAGEALALFAVPAGVSGALARMGYGVIASFAISGAASSVSLRGVQDVGAGSFSGVEAYVVDAGTGAVIGVIVGGTFRALGGTLGAPAARPGLTHFTDPAGAAGIASEGALRGGQGIYALPSSAAQQARWIRFLRTLLHPAQTASPVPVPPGAGGQFIQPVPVGPISLYQNLAGVYRAPAGAISMTSGAFTPGGRVFGNITGQFWPYGVDAVIWISAAAMSPASSDAGERGVTGALGLPSSLSGLLAGPPPPVTTRTDGPFIELPLWALPIGVEDVLAGAEAGEDPIRRVCEQPPPEALQSHADEPPAMGAEALPGLILVLPELDLGAAPSAVPDPPG
jgi:hypothetical protein